MSGLSLGWKRVLYRRRGLLVCGEGSGRNQSGSAGEHTMKDAIPFSSLSKVSVPHLSCFIMYPQKSSASLRVAASVCSVVMLVVGLAESE